MRGRPVLAVILGVVGVLGQENLSGSREEMGRGVKLFQNGRYGEAATAFEKAAAMAPTNLEAKLYLGVCYMAQFRAGSTEAANLEFARRAEQQFMAILEREPADDTALSYMANLEYQRSIGLRDPAEKQKQLERAKEWFEELAEQVPGNKEAPFNLAVIAWQQAHPQWLSARERAGLKPEDPGPVKDASARAAMQASCVPLWEESVKQLHRALEIDANFDNAMGYLSMVLRERADMAANEDEYRRQIAEADEWTRKAAEGRKQKGADSGAGQ